MKKDKAFRTLLTSVLFSASGPIILGAGLMVGRSSTQIADFTRRSAELLALITALVLFCITENNEKMNDAEKEKWKSIGNLLVGLIMCLSGILMLAVLLIFGKQDKGNVIPALVISLLGVIFNSYFFFRYTSLYKKSANTILGVQGRLYGAKSMVDICVTLSLVMILLFPATKVSAAFDTIGTFAVSVYMVCCGIKTVREALVRENK